MEFPDSDEKPVLGKKTDPALARAFTGPCAVWKREGTEGEDRFRTQNAKKVKDDKKREAC